MYHLDINGQRVTNLRPDAATRSAKIFTGVIKIWDDPAITADNPQLAAPEPRDPRRSCAPTARARPRSSRRTWRARRPTSGTRSASGSGSTSTRARRRRSARRPTRSSQQFSDGVADYVAAPYNNGAITYVEYGYAKQRGFPVARSCNQAGYFTQPTAPAVAIALQARAAINPDGTQNLQGVYINPDPRAYPMSSYSYMIVPTTTAAPFTAAKGRDARPVHPLLRVRRASRRPSNSATRRCRRISCRTRSTWCRRFPDTSIRHRSTSARTRRSRSSSSPGTRRPRPRRRDKTRRRPRRRHRPTPTSRIRPRTRSRPAALDPTTRDHHAGTSAATPARTPATTAGTVAPTPAANSLESSRSPLRSGRYAYRRSTTRSR